MAKGQKCSVCGEYTLQPYTANILKCSNPKCGVTIPKANLGK